ncbi:tRNA pseudouridine(55) synthase TruB [Candidatus Gracilibacteria bacterium]|nr:tRNA pseudouridine(55) synthase TruB [Candidatus Gracilibacteria bacterium]
MFYLINKPTGFTSFDVVNKIRKKFQIKKAGHTGTLDPLASGLLIVATGNSTKLISFLDKLNKKYKFTFNLDGFTQTGDLGSEIKYLDEKLIKKGEKEITLKKIENVIKSDFFGIIKQIPPKYSAIKIGGKRAYTLARNNENFQVPVRKVEIFSYKIIDFKFPSLTLEMEVGTGTYIRTIAEDIGKKLGLNGYVTKLERIKIGNFSLSEGKKLDEILVSDFTSYKKIFPNFQELQLDKKTVEDIKNGIVVKNKFALEEGQKYFIKSGDKYVSLLEIKSGNMVILKNKIE